MSGMADDRAAYLEATRRAEEAAGITRDDLGNEVYAEGEPPVATPELDGAVPIPASDQPLTPEPVTPTATSVEPQEAPAVEPTAEELKAQLAAAEARIEEQKTMIGRQSAEVGETREQIAGLQAQIAAVQAQQAATPQVITPIVPVTQSDIDNDPAEAAQRALAQRDEPALNRAFEAWKEFDPFTAAAWLSDRKLEQAQAAFDEKLAAAQKQIESATAPLAQSAAESAELQQWAAAFDEVKATRPDFIENAPRLLEEVAPQYPSFLPALQSGDAKAKAEALAALYALDKMGNPQAVQAQLAEAAEEAAAEAAAARTAAGAVTSQTTAGQSSELKTEEELEQDRYIARQRNKPSLSQGWTGRG